MINFVVGEEVQTKYGRGQVILVDKDSMTAVVILDDKSQVSVALFQLAKVVLNGNNDSNCP